MAEGFEIEVDEGIPVKLPSGATFLVLTQSEREYVQERVERYFTDIKLTNVADLQELDRAISFELLIHRWNLWMSKQVDYYNDPVDVKLLAQQTNAFSTELRLIKKNLGIDKVARDRVRGDDSTSTYLDNLRVRAKAFGVFRNKQSAKSIELFQQLKALLTFHDNCLTGNTPVLTREGVKPIGELSTAKILNGQEEWVEVNFRSYGVQPVTELSLACGDERMLVRCTMDHHWVIPLGVQKVPSLVSTEQLIHGDRLAGVDCEWTLFRKAFVPAEEVFCCTEPATGIFTLGENLLTGNCDEIERRENGCTQDDVMNWVRDVAIPEFDALDDSFKQNEQQFWVRGQ